jgi:hypothetical protein
MKVFAETAGKVDRLQINVRASNGETEFQITRDHGTPEAVSYTMKLQRDIAWQVVKQMTVELRALDPNEEETTYRFEP